MVTYVRIDCQSYLLPTFCVQTNHKLMFYHLKFKLGAQLSGLLPVYVIMDSGRDYASQCVCSSDRIL